MRKEVRSIAVGTATHIVDRFRGNAGVQELKGDEPGQVTVRSFTAAIDHGSTPCRALHFAGDFFSDLESADSNVRADRGHELAGLVRQDLDRPRDDASDRASPSGMHRRDVAASRVGDQNRHAIGGPRRDRVSGDACASSDAVISRTK
jgi:hypothetical protein